MVLHDFTPCVDDELEVKRGQVGWKPFPHCNNHHESQSNTRKSTIIEGGEGGNHVELEVSSMVGFHFNVHMKIPTTHELNA